MDRDAVRAHLDLLLLAAVEREPLHGYAIIQELRARSGGRFDFPEGTIYPALHRLEEADLLESRWSLPPGRRKRIYRLTRAGRAALELQQREWHELSRGVEAVLAASA